MPDDIDPDHPTVGLYFRAQERHDRGLRARLQEMMARLASTRAWTLGPPEFVEDIDDDGETVVVFIGALLTLHESRWHSIPIEIDRRQLDDAEAFVAAAWTLSDQTPAELEFFYAGEQVGELVGGVLDPAIGLMVIDPWRAQIEARER